MESLSRLFILFAFVYSAVAVPLSRKEKCARHCTESSRFQFNPGTTYTYDYETLTTTNLKGTSEDSSQLQMKAQVDIEVLSKCDLSLRLRGVTLKQSDPQNPDYLMPIKGGRDFGHAAQRHILRFSYQDGAVQDLCPDEVAPAWLTNIQRGVLSAFQNSMNNLEGNERHIETDVGGKCTVEYQSLGRSWRGSLTIRKMKDLNTCTDRQSADTSLQGTPFTHGSSIQSTPLVNGRQECEQVIGSGIIQSSTCTETHVLRPFSRGQGGAITTVHQKLIYVTATQQKFTGNDYRPTRGNLLFDHGKETVTTGNDEEEAERSLAKLCEASLTDITISVPGMFAAFVYRMKKLNYESFGNIYKRVETICPNNPKAKKFFLDAVPVISTVGSVKFMSGMISRREVEESEINFWFTSMSFVSEPTIEMITNLTPLLDGTHEQAFFGVSSLVHTFCKSNDCSDSEEVRAVIHKLFSNLGENCYNPDVKKVLLTLKSIANIGIPFGREKILERCAVNPQLETEVRISAIQAFRRYSCDTSRENFLKMYTNYNEDSEIRIAAYLAVIRCPEEETLQIIRTTLESEVVNQVGSFVWTHLRALAKSQHPDRQDIKDMLSNLHLMNKYESDIRKFSSAKEASFFLESLESGFHVDTQLIYPTNSFIPHSASFNLTLDVFGHNCNLLQLDGRLEGMERLMEKFFGPSGYFPQKQVSNFMRSKRSTLHRNSKIDRMDKEFDVSSSFDKSPYGSLDVKIFGNTMWYSQFREDDQDGSSVNLMDLISDLAKRQEKEFSRSFMFLDTNYAIPMASGLPLRLSLNGTATVGLKLGGKFDVRSIENVDVLANIEPSGAVEIAGLLTVDVGGVARTGLRIAATVHSSTVLDTRVEVRNGQVVKAQLNLPREKIEIVDVQSKLYLVFGSEEREQNAVRDNSYHFDSCTGETSRKMLGVELCTAISLPKGHRNSPMYPMSGAAYMSLYIKKTDPTLTAYNFDASWERKIVNGKSIRNCVISLNTPQSTIDREVGLLLEVSEPDNTFKFELKSPVKKLSIKAKYANGRSMKKLDISATVDEKDTYAARGELRSASEEGGISFFPTLDIQIPSRTVMSLSGSAHLRHGLKYGGQLTIKELTTRPITLKGNLDLKERDRYEGELSLNCFAIDTTTKLNMQLSDIMSFKLNTDYRIMESKQYRFNLNGKVRDLSANALIKYSTILNMQATAFPEWDTSVSLQTMTTEGHIENTFSISVGDSTRSRVHTINVQEILRYKGDLTDNSGELVLKFSYPQKQISYAFDMKHQNTAKSLKNEMEIKYGVNKEIATVVNLDLKGENYVHYSGDLQLRYPGRSTKLSAEVRENNPQDYRAQLSLQYQEGKTIGLTTHYKNKGDNVNFRHEVNAEMTFSYRQPITFHSSVGSLKGQYSGIAEVNLGLDKYRMNVDYIKGSGINHRVNGELMLGTDVYSGNAQFHHSNDKTSVGIETKLPSHRRLYTKVDIKNAQFLKAIKFESMWDADVDYAKRFGFDWELRLKNNGFDLTHVTQYRRRTIKGYLSTMREGQWTGNYLRSLYKAEIEWTPADTITITLNTNMLRERERRQVTSMLEATTPFKGFERVTVNAKHGTENKQWSSEVSGTWGTRNKMSFSTDGKYSFTGRTANAEATVKFDSPFRNYESLSFNASHFHNYEEFSNKMMLQMGRGKRFTSELYYNDQTTGFKCGAKLTTPYAVAPDTSAELTHTHKSGSYKTGVVLQWEPRKKINAALDLRHVFNGRRRSCSVNFVATTPFMDYESLSSKFLYNHEGTAVNSEYEVIKNHNKIMTGGFSGSYQSSYYSKNFDSKVYFTSIIPRFENIQVTTLFLSTTESYKFNIEVQTPNEITVSLNSEGKAISLKDVELNVVLNSNLPEYLIVRPFTFDFVHKVQNSNLRTSFDVIVEQKQTTILLTGMSKPGYKSQDLEGTLSIKTPFRGYEEMKLSGTHKTRDWEFMTRVEGNRNRDRFLLVHNTNIKDALNIESNFHFTSSAKYLKEIKANLAQVSNTGFFAHNAKVQWDKDKNVEFNMRYQSRMSTKNFALNLETPFDNVKSCIISADYEFSHTEYKAKLSALLNDKKMLELDSTIPNFTTERGNVDIQLVSNFGKSKSYGINGRYDVSIPQKSAEMTFQWNHRSRRAITVNGNLLLNYQTPYFDIKIKTPFHRFEKIYLRALLKNQPTNKYVSLEYETNMHKLAGSVKVLTSRIGAHLDVNLVSPFTKFENMRLSSKYQIEDGAVSGELECHWNHKKLTSAIEASLKDSRAEGKLLFTSPFKGYQTLSMNGLADISKRKRTAEMSVLWSDGEKMEFRAECETKKKREGKFSVEFRSPFESMRFLKGSSYYRTGSEETNGNIEFQNDNNVYKCEAKYMPKGKFEVTLTTPHRPLRNVELKVTTSNSYAHRGIDSSLKLENKEIVFTLYQKNNNDDMEVNLNLNVPFENKQDFSLQGEFRNNNYKSMNGRFTVTTPFETLPNFETSSSYNDGEDSYEALINIKTTPEKALTLTGHMDKLSRRPFRATLNIDAPAMKFQNLALTAKSDLQTTAELAWITPKSKHTVSVLAKAEDRVFTFETKLQSPLLTTGRSQVVFKGDLKDPGRMEIDLSAFAFGKSHSLLAFYRNQRNTYEAQVKVTCPGLPGKEAEFQINYIIDRQKRIIESKLIYSGSIHQSKVSVEYDPRQVFASVSLDSDYLPMSKVQATGSYVNSNNRDLEVILKLETPENKHEMTTSIKNYNQDKFFQLKLRSPTLPSNQLSVTSTLKYDVSEAIDGSVSMTYAGEETRVALNMKRQGWNSVEGFLAINTPFERLTMLRTDIGLKNDRFKNIEGSIQVVTSNQQYPISLSAKMSRQTGSEDVSLMFRLPNSRYHTVNLLANVHYNRYITKSDARITVSVPSERYSVYGQYDLSDTTFTANGEVEHNKKKWMMAGQAKYQPTIKGLSMVLTTPNSGSYEFASSLNQDNIHHTISLFYSNPEEKVFRSNVTIDYISSSNVNVQLEATTPLADYQRMYARLRHQRKPHQMFFADAEYSLNNRRGYFNILHRNNNPDYVSTIKAGSPFRSFREIEFTLSKNRDGMDRNLEIVFNRQRKAKLEMTTTEEATTYVMDLPPLPLTITGKFKPREHGQEISIKSNYPTRTMSIHTVYARHPGYFANEALLVWDEAEQKSISYNTRVNDVRKGQTVGKEFFFRVNFPRRSVEVRGKLARSNRVQSGGVDIFWDASRDMKKNMTIGVEHQNLSTRHLLSQKFQMMLTHPSLGSDLIQSNLLTMSSSELRFKSDLQYTRNNEHNFVIELTANDLSRNRRDRHYKSELAVRHLVSHLDFRMTGEAMNNDDEMSTHLKVNYGHRTGQQTIREMRAKIMKIRQEIDVLIRSGENKMTMLGRMQRKGNDLSLSLDQDVNDRRTLRTHVRYNDELRSLNANLTMAQSRGMHLTASFPADSISMKLSHTNDVSATTDAFVFIGLEKSRLFKTRINWRPGMWRDFRIATGDTLRGMANTIGKGANDLTSEIVAEWSPKLQGAGRSMVENIMPLQRQLKRDYALLMTDVQAAKDAFRMMYEENDFYIRNIVHEVVQAYKTVKSACGTIGVVIDTLHNIFNEAMEELQDTIYNFLEDVSICISDCNKRFKAFVGRFSRYVADSVSKIWKSTCKTAGHFYRRWRRSVGKVVSNTVERMESLVRMYAPCIIDMYYSARLFADNIREKIAATSDAFGQTVVNHPLYMALSQYCSQVVATIHAFEVSDLTSSIHTRVLFLGEQAGSFLNKLSDGQLLDLIRNRIPVDYVADVAKVTLRKGVDLYQALGMNSLVNTVFGYGIDHLKEVVLSSGNELLQEFYQLKTGAKYDFDLKNGVLTLEYMLPTSSNSIYDVFNLPKYSEYKKLMEIKNTLVTRYYEDFCIWDLYYRIKNSVFPSNWMPPFTAHGMLAGNQHYVTFDKFSFDFAGECSYLLARDFLDGNFSVIANYMRNGRRVLRKSLTVLSDSAKLDVVSDYKVTLNDVKVELPIKVHDTTVTREGSSVRIQNLKKGFVVICNFVHDVCTVGMSGFYFGRTGGLLGTYDNEPRLDFMTPDKKVANDVESLAAAWEVGQGTCTRTENMATVPSNDQRVQERCAELFVKSSSGFRACFKQVKPTPFASMCISDLSAVSESDFDSAICVSAAAYFTECKIEGVELKMPKSCVRCETDQGAPMYEGNAMRFNHDHPLRSADVVFIVEEKECNAKNYKFLEKLSQSIDDNFREQGFQDVRFRVVGFGGDDVHSEPHVHTMEGKEYGNIGAVSSAFDSLRVGDGPTNVLEALRFAAALNYHPGSVKNFMLLKCSTCLPEENKVAYGEVLRTLLDAEINLHVMMEQKYEMKIAKNSKARKVIGLDKNFAYTLKDIKDSNLLGDGDLLAQLKMPKDICLPLALEVNGSTFDSQYITDTKRNTYKKFMDVVSRRMLQSAKQRSGRDMCCECIASDEGVGRTTCQRCVSTEVANMISGDLFSPYTRNEYRQNSWGSDNNNI